MDSFYDVPRRAPVPTQFENFLAAPVVPEVSMICPLKTQMNNYPYNSWKNQHSPNNIFLSQKEDLVSPQNTSQCMKKQVRFESPILQQKLPFISKNVEIANPNPIQNQNCKSRLDNPHSITNSERNKFKQMYMANIPKRELDLSIIDLPKNGNQVRKSSEDIKQPDFITTPKIIDSNDLTNQNKETGIINEKILPKTYKEFLEIQKKPITKNETLLNDSITDIFNYRREKIQIDDRIFTESRQQTPVINRPQINIPHNNLHKECKPSPSPPKYAYVATDSIPLNTDDTIARMSYMNKKNLPFPKCDGVTQTGPSCIDHGENVNSKIIDKDIEPSNRDLLKIIAQQNEQLLLLQKQVAMLLSRDQQQQSKPIEAPPICHGEKLVSSTQNEYYRQDATPQKRMSKFSIDLMTSFEVAIRPQHKQNYINMEPKIQEITEPETITNSKSAVEKGEGVIEQSLHFQEPVREMCPSPEPSININMQEYDSSDEEATVSEIGATFYRNLMGQVNDILKKAHLHTQEELGIRDQAHKPLVFKKTGGTMNKVKEATLKHLKSIGVTIGPLEDSDESVCPSDENKDYSPTEISFAIKQLLMKYLPDDQLAKVAQKQPPEPVYIDKHPGIIPGRPEFSFASVQYMKKYNLLPSDKLKPIRREIPKQTHGQVAGDQKFLDMTALKMQPKFL